MRFRSTAVVAALGLLAAACADEPSTAPRTGPQLSTVAAEGATYVILGNGNTLPSGLAAKLAAAGGTLTASLDGIGVAIATSTDPDFAAKVGRISGVQDVAQDVMLDFGQPQVGGEEVADVAAEPDLGQASHVGAVETFRALQWAPDAISAPAAWHAGYTGAGARVAILDGGIHSTHIDIAPNLDVARSASFVPGQPFNNDNARVNGVCGSAHDTFWHGTHVAGIVAAPANDRGTVGIAPAATLIGVKVLHCGSGAFSWIIQGIYYAATPIAEGGAGAHIINMSLGAQFDRQGRGAAQLVNALSRASSYATQRGTLVIAAAGNNATDLDHTNNMVFVPAQAANVVAVSALGPMGWAVPGNTFDLDRPASYTNWGQSAINLSGPGGDFALPGSQVCSKPRFPAGVVNQFCWVMDMVMAPSRGSVASISTYSWAAGTSMASPAVAGVAALVVGKYGPMQPAQLLAILRQSADDLGKPGNDDFYGRGRVNAWRAVQ